MSHGVRQLEQDVNLFRPGMVELTAMRFCLHLLAGPKVGSGKEFENREIVRLALGDRLQQRGCFGRAVFFQEDLGRRNGYSLVLAVDGVGAFDELRPAVLPAGITRLYPLRRPRSSKKKRSEEHTS